ncbi:MAG: high-potential iron-sulfur protein [Saprospiraceae bacterium]|nr:high-potential iron-sulfur protein [Saprospiraceae bacterium]
MKRRRLLRRRMIIKNVASFSLLVWAGCAGKASRQETHVPKACDDYTGLQESDLQLRKGFGYVEESPIPESHCKNCNLFKVPGEGEVCGGCTLFKGPVFENGYCTYWAPQI